MAQNGIGVFFIIHMEYLRNARDITRINTTMVNTRAFHATPTARTATHVPTAEITDL